MSDDKTLHQNLDERDAARQMSLAPTKPPSKLNGYRITDFVGSGAYGEVWAGIDTNTGKQVAIKFYTRRSATDVAQLAQEVQKLVVLSTDRYVVQLLDVGWDSSPPYYVMDYFEHGSLEDRLKSQGTLPVADAVDMFEEIATGLMHLHGKGVFHCDIKPGNILLDQDDKPRLCDFGQSRLSSDSAAALGTLYYMAPEQADLDAVPDGRWDVYALGAMLYNMLTGEPPYRDPALSETIEKTSDIHERLKFYRDKIRKSPKPTAHRKIAGVDRALADIIDRCIKPDPNKRFASVQSVLLALRAREESIAFRPLLLLGLLGPFLLMVMMGLFGWYAYNRAVGDTDVAVTQKAIESNKFAARLAARSASEQVDKYFRVVKKWADDVSVQASLAHAFDDEAFLELRQQLTDPNQNTDPKLDTLRQQFRTHPTRLNLQKASEFKRQDMPLGAASWWIYDPFGVQIASSFRHGKQSPTIGKNYSYRSYFTGLKKDLIDLDPDAERKFTVEEVSTRPHATEPTLSAIFFSDATATWKIAFSAPVYSGENFVGVVGLTVEMGNFINFDSGKGQQQYAMMVDGRPGMHRGIVLEHPFFTKHKKENESKLDDSLTHCQVDMEALLEAKARFQDPIGQTQLGADYSPEHLAAAWEIEYTKVSVLGDEEAEALPENKINTGLYVVAVENYEGIIGPAKKLGIQLAWLGTLASLLLLLVALGLWFLVLKSTRDSRQRFARAFTASPDSSRSSLSPSSLQTAPTMNHPSAANRNSGSEAPTIRKDHTVDQ